MKWHRSASTKQTELKTPPSVILVCFSRLPLNHTDFTFNPPSGFRWISFHPGVTISIQLLWRLTLVVCLMTLWRLGFLKDGCTIVTDNLEKIVTGNCWFTSCFLSCNLAWITVLVLFSTDWEKLQWYQEEKKLHHLMILQILTVMDQLSISAVNFKPLKLFIDGKWNQQLPGRKEVPALNGGFEMIVWDGRRGYRVQIRPAG